LGAVKAGIDGLGIDEALIRGNVTFGADTVSYHGIGGNEAGRSLLPQFGQSGGTARHAVNSTSPRIARPATSSRAARYR
jgi:hypothetical protein